MVIVVFGLQLLLNVLWSALFFGLRNPGLGVVGILLLWLAIVVTMRVFWSSSRIASLFLVPYLGWSSFAAALNGTIWWLNLR